MRPAIRFFLSLSVILLVSGCASQSDNLYRQGSAQHRNCEPSHVPGQKPVCSEVFWTSGEGLVQPPRRDDNQ